MGSGTKLEEQPLGRGPPRILLAEDDKAMRALLARALRKTGYQIAECPDGMDLLKHLQSFFLPHEHEDVDLIISDIRMPGASGMEVLSRIREQDNFLPMILITAFGDEKTHAQAKQLGAAAMFDKPFDIDELVAKVCTIVPLSETSAVSSQSRNSDNGCRQQGDDL
jgi:DNA-binding response OmpR family regulator